MFAESFPDDLQDTDTARTYRPKATSFQIDMVYILPMNMFSNAYLTVTIHNDRLTPFTELNEDWKWEQIQ